LEAKTSNYPASLIDTFLATDHTRSRCSIGECAECLLSNRSPSFIHRHQSTCL